MTSDSINSFANPHPQTCLLDAIQQPSDLRQLSLVELEQLCAELRDELVNTVGMVGGHFASSLGVVELTVACHTIFNTPDDRLIWDVGHQAYIHKMLTGRRKQLRGVRQFGGISGFPKRSESEYDTFGVGHAGTSISAASGMLEALHHLGQNDRRVISIIGDGAMTAGMSFEALNHSGQLHKKLIVILNDNEMSISPNVGALSWAFSRTLSGRLGTFARRHFKNLVEKRVIPHTFYRGLDRFEDAAQGFLSTPAMLFESFGYRYIGPVDGHSMSQLMEALERAKNQDGPVIVHAITTKGKGYGPAEEDPVKFHGVDPFHKKNPSPGKSCSAAIPSYTSVFSKTILEICRENPSVVGITAAMPDGTGLQSLAEELPRQFYDVGIAEQHAVTFAAGLACEGMKPVCAIYSTFLQRAYDQIVHDVCLQALPVVFAIDRAGLVGADGPTHHGVFDISSLRAIPNLVFMAPKDEAELRDMLWTSTEHLDVPCAIRFPRGQGIGKDLSALPKKIAIGKGEVLRTSANSSTRVMILALGPSVYSALIAAEKLEALFPCSVTVVNPRFIKPLDEELLYELLPKHQLLVTVEDHAIAGGFGSAVLEAAANMNLLGQADILRLGVPDNFIDHGTQEQLYRLCGFDSAGIVANVSRYLNTVLELRHPDLREFAVG